MVLTMASIMETNGNGTIWTSSTLLLCQHIKLQIDLHGNYALMNKMLRSVLRC